MYFSGLRYGVYQNAVLYGMSFILLVLTFLYISFAKIFCQNLVKKNCKYVVRIYSKYGGIRRGKGHGMYLSGEPKICAAIAMKVYRLW